MTETAAQREFALSLLTQAYLRAQLARYPEIICGIIGVATAVCAVANFLVIQRLRMLQAPTRASFATFIQTGLLYALGSALALLSSQTFLWEISEASWNVGAWVAQDPERPSTYLSGILGFALAALLARMLWTMGASPPLTALGSVFCRRFCRYQWRSGSSCQRTCYDGTTQ
jgi:hypothetical protein